MTHLTRKTITAILAWTLLFSTFAFGQAKPVDAATSLVSERSDVTDGYLIDVTAGYDLTTSYRAETKMIVKTLSSTAKSPVLIDDQGYARDLVVQSVATTSRKALLESGWPALTGMHSSLSTTLQAVIEY